MARVFGADGVTDATAIEMRVKKAQMERQAAHDDRNAARKLLPSERKAKQLRKMFDEDACDVHVQVGRCVV
jgi:U4/U6 small nuclear ribonucleoprotein PRP3